VDHGHPLHLGLEVRLPDAAQEADRLGLDLVVVHDETGPDETGPDATGPDPMAPGTTGPRRTPPVPDRDPASSGTASSSTGATASATADGPAPALDPWTLLTVVAATTERVQVATAGLRLDDRPPAVLARAAAGLDHLTGGRVALGLAVDGDPVATDEATTVLRGMWDAADPSPLRVAGRHHQVPGAQRGPAPAHLLPVWLSARDGRPLPADVDLALAARVADGWWTRLPAGAPLDETALADLADLRARLDDAASTAGRDPRELRLLLTVDLAAVHAAGARAAADLLARAVLDAGVGTVVLGGADAADARRAAPVLAEVRSAVAATRAARGTVVTSVRSAAVRAARRAGIDYDTIPAGLRGTAVEPGDPAYAGVRSTYMRGGRPGLVLRPGSTAEVVEALAWARTQPVPLAVRSGGHGISGRSTNDGGLVLDLGRMNAIEVLDVATRRVRVGPGARWGEVAQALRPYGWAITSGDYGGVGVGGLATAGGIGFLAREHGLTIDHVRAVEMVLADGTVLRADAEQHADLFWGVRGAGGNLGIVTSFELEADEVGDVGFAQLVFDATDLEDFLHRFGTLVEAAPRDLTPFLILGRPRGGHVVAQMMAVVDSDDPGTIIDRLQPFASLGPLLQQAVQVVPYTAVVSLPDAAHAGEGEPVTRAAMLEHLTPAFAADAARLIRSGETYFFQLRSAGGAVGDVPADATAYPHRGAQFSLVAFGSSRRRLDAAWEAMAAHSTGGYSSFETDPRPERLPELFGHAGLARLRALKQRYDPQDVFGHNHSVAERAGAGTRAGA
jgi:alkanesulfonate monooxygenase SsuD/methylene tetrahydromethanopterin reductase-like flavin-dependent oxidoreductase (luciferase family)